MKFDSMVIARTSYLDTFSTNVTEMTNCSLEVGFHGQGFREEGSPVARQEIPALHLHPQAMHLQLLPQEGLLIEVVSPDEDEGCAVTQALGGGAVSDLAQHTVGCIHLQCHTSAYHLDSLAQGQRAMDNGQWVMGNEKWAMRNGRWEMGNWGWAMGIAAVKACLVIR